MTFERSPCPLKAFLEVQHTSKRLFSPKSIYTPHPLRPKWVQQVSARLRPVYYRLKIYSFTLSKANYKLNWLIQIAMVVLLFSIQTSILVIHILIIFSCYRTKAQSTFCYYMIHNSRYMNHHSWFRRQSNNFSTQTNCCHVKYHAEQLLCKSHSCIYFRRIESDLEQSLREMVVQHSSCQNSVVITVLSLFWDKRLQSFTSKTSKFGQFYVFPVQKKGWYYGN